jgi:bloom syndrome protein
MYFADANGNANRNISNVNTGNNSYSNIQNSYQANQTYANANNNNRDAKVNANVNRAPPLNQPQRNPPNNNPQANNQPQNRNENRPASRPQQNSHNAIKDEFGIDQTKNLTNLQTFYALQIKKNLNLNDKNYELANTDYWDESSYSWDITIASKNRSVFGHQKFRMNQKGIINACKSKEDVFVCMPTGGGKSLCFQLPALTDPGVSIVIMPLLSLIHDQCFQMEGLGVPVLEATGQSNYQTVADGFYAIQNCHANYPKIIYVTPEKLVQGQGFNRELRTLYQMGRIDRFVIDEAHCVSHWGHEFRRDYLQLCTIRENFPGIPILALTATATETVRCDVIKLLKMKKNTKYFQTSFNRPNLYYHTEDKKDDDSMMSIITSYCKEKYQRKSGIIYCATIKEVALVTDKLRCKGVLAAEYHGKLEDAVKRKNQTDWMNDEIQVICATIAFGMGINKPDVRFVVHTTFSKSVENYYQESGRAGRDGFPAHCTVFYREKDRDIHDFFIHNNAESSDAQKTSGLGNLNRMIYFCQDNVICKRVFQ